MVRVRTALNSRQKAALAAMIIRGIADIFAHYEVHKERYPEYPDLMGVDIVVLKSQAARWLGRYLPGDAWDDRLPRTFHTAQHGMRDGDLGRPYAERYASDNRTRMAVELEPPEPGEEEVPE